MTDVTKDNKVIIDKQEINLQDETVVNIFKIKGLIETVSVVPTDKPIKLSKQFRIYKNGATKRFYWYDSVNQEWSYATGT